MTREHAQPRPEGGLGCEQGSPRPPFLRSPGGVLQPSVMTAALSYGIEALTEKVRRSSARRGVGTFWGRGRGASLFTFSASDVPFRAEAFFGKGDGAMCAFVWFFWPFPTWAVPCAVRASIPLPFLTACLARVRSQTPPPLIVAHARTDGFGVRAGARRQKSALRSVTLWNWGDGFAWGGRDLDVTRRIVGVPCVV